MSSAIRAAHVETSSHDAELFGEVQAEQEEPSPHLGAETRCLGCGRQLLEELHAGWCDHRVKRKGEPTMVNLGTTQQIAERARRWRTMPTIGSVRRAAKALEAVVTAATSAP